MSNAGLTSAQVVSTLSDEQKVTLTGGASLWRTHSIDSHGIRPLLMADGPAGVRFHGDGDGTSMVHSDPATCFPSAVSLGSTWNPELVERVAIALGEEAAVHGIDMILGPGVNLKRSPIGGRNFEYLSEDPHLSGTLGAAWVRGVQKTGVGAAVKHFAANNTEDRRYGIDVLVDDRALRELYLANFETVIGAKPAAVMAAYSKLNGIHCTENTWLLQDVLRAEWGFEGIVVSDWGAAWDRVLALPGGTDLSMPGRENDGQRVLEAARAGRIPTAALDRAARLIVEMASRPPVSSSGVDFDAHHELARAAAADGTILLRNEANLLPLSAQRVAFIGSFAAEPRIQGAGSSHVVPTREDTILEAAVRELGAAAVSYSDGYDRISHETSPAQLVDAARVAAEADVAVVVIGLPDSFETEGIDRQHMTLPPSHNALVDAVLAANPRTVVILQNGSPVEMPWRENVPAILETYLTGQANGSATVDVLLGIREPGGRLAETLPIRLSDHPTTYTPAGPSQLEYWESLYVGYRYFDSAEAEVAYPFGHGLSYTSFEWSDVSLNATAITADDEQGVVAELTITNTGTRRGSDVIQLYVHDGHAPALRPEQELRGFAKVTLDPGESTLVSVQLPPRAFSFWSTVDHAWRVAPGTFEVRAGASSRDIRSHAALTVTGAVVPAETMPDAYRLHTPRKFTRAGFAALYGRALPDSVTPDRRSFSTDTALRDMQGSAVGRWLFRTTLKQVSEALGINEAPHMRAVAERVVGQFNLRMLPTMSNGGVHRQRVEVLLRLLRLFPESRPRRLAGAAHSRNS